MQNNAAMMEAVVFRVSARIHITHYHTFPSCLKSELLIGHPGTHTVSHWLACSAGHLMPVPDISESEIPGSGRMARYAIGESDVESWAEDAMLQPPDPALPPALSCQCCQPEPCLCPIWHQRLLKT